MSDKKLSVAFIGTGIMGAPIAGHILDAGYPVTVYNRTKAKTDDLVSRGAVWADSPAAAAKDADVVFTMVGYPADVEEIYLSGDGLLAAAKPGAYLIDLTTSAPELARDIAEAAETYGKHAFDCPVTGGDTGAIAGTLTLIVGATDEGIEPVRDILETFSSKIYCFGGPGKGQAAKLANQVALSSCMVGIDVYKRQARERSGIMEALACVRSLLRDVLLLVQDDAASIVNEDARDIACRLAEHATCTGIVRAIEAVGDAEHRIARNITPQLTCEVMLFDIRKALLCP